MGDNATIQARPRLSPAVGGAAPGDLGDLDKKPPRTSGSANRYPQTRGDSGTPTLGTPSSTPPGTALERKKSYHPELRLTADFPASARDVFSGGGGLGQNMELIHLNRTCTSVDLASPYLGLGLRCASDTDLADEETVHRVRHQVSFAHGADPNSGGPPVQCEDFISALRSRIRAGTHEHHDGSDQEDPDEEAAGTPDTQDDEDQDDGSYAFLDNPSNLSPDSDVDYLAVRPSLASTQLNEIRPN